ncbi:hypothetical protein V8G54_036438 [Vigna mungo]|uniref:Uncharacterized protein n=1 Tax=Vigna mungo TaxID=3915 RepID=A0AAQ3MGS9_VIGMU
MGMWLLHHVMDEDNHPSRNQRRLDCALSGRCGTQVRRSAFMLRRLAVLLLKRLALNAGAGTQRWAWLYLFHSALALKRLAMYKLKKSALNGRSDTQHWRTKTIPSSERNASPLGWISDKKMGVQGLYTFVHMTGDYYPDLVQVFYNNVKVVDGNIHSHVKGVDIIINNDTCQLSHLPECLQNRHTRKTQMFKDCMRYPGRYKKEKGFLYKWLDKDSWETGLRKSSKEQT